MVKKKDLGNDITLISFEEEQGKCELCENVSDLRPYGPNGEKICYPCGQLDMETTYKKMTEAVMKQLNLPIENYNVEVTVLNEPDSKTRTLH